jgi:ADP-ribose pyrophosphatase YjhB (NUDIX family)
MSFPFNVRAYGALVHAGHILLSKENYGGMAFTKLPGGGLEFGEGLKDTVVREFLEETGLRVHVVSHLYTTDFFQVSAFNPRDQVISVYFQVSAEGLGTPPPKIEPLDDGQDFIWKLISELTEEDFTFPIDKRLVEEFKKLN